MKKAVKILTKGKQKPALTKGKAALTKGKAALPKGKGKTNSGSSTDKKVKKTFLKKEQLEKLSKMTLAQKVAKATEHADTAEEAAQNLKGMLNKSERSRVWSKYNVMMNKKTTKEKKAYEKLSKTEKGMHAALQLVKSTAPKFTQTKESIGQQSTLDQREEWKSDAKMLQDFGPEDFQQHLDSGRIIWRAHPWTSGVYNYRDKVDIVKHTKVKKTKEYGQAQEYEADERRRKGSQKGLSLTKGKKAKARARASHSCWPWRMETHSMMKIQTLRVRKLKMKKRNGKKC